MTAEIGRVLGGRYRLIAPIGMGASAQVYLADDVRLRRRVALKMLHDALAGDVAFLRRFRAEARAAAALSHPNVMAVYDWGDDDVAFIVTEYLGGGSLRGLLDGGSLLTLSQALAVGLEATRALDYAHRRGFVHRDIKPANLLFGDDQRLRIADFGLARALAEAAWTEPQGAMLGTARYASPEQAKGESLDGKADVYAIALVMVEAVTGVVPFAADTTLGTLMARVERPLEAPEELGALRAILNRAGHVDPARRIDARTLAAGLLRAAKTLPRPTPLALAGAMEGGHHLAVDPDPTPHGPLPEVALAPPFPIDMTDDDLDLDPPDWVNKAEAGGGFDGGPTGPWPMIDPEPEPQVVSVTADPAPLAGPVEAETDGSEPVVMGDGSDRADEAAAAGGLGGARALTSPDGLGAPDTTDTTGAAGAPDATGASDLDGSLDGAPASSEPPDDGHELVGAGFGAGAGGDAGEPRRRRRWPWVVVVVLVLLGGGGVAAAAVISDDPPPPRPTVVLPVPELTDRSQADAESVAEAAGWKTTVTTERRDDTRKGQVLATDPVPGTRLARGGSVELVVSAGQTVVEVPDDLAGKTVADATAALEAAGLRGEPGETRFDEDVPEGSVLGVAGGTAPRLEKGTMVPLVVSDGPEPRTVPSGLVGNTEAGATDALQALGLDVAVDRRFNDTVDEGRVVSQRPRPGEKVPKGSTVTIEVSKGPELVAVPDVSGAATSAEAAAIIRRAGLTPGVVSGSSEGSPSGTKPGTGTEVKPGTTVDIVQG